MSTKGNVRYHIAKTGKKAGKWVTCNASIQCKNNSVHANPTILKKIKQETDKKNIQQITTKEYIAYLKNFSTNNNKTKIQDPYRETADEKTAQFARENNLDGAAPFKEPIVINRKNKLMAFIKIANTHRVSIPLDALKEAGEYFNDNQGKTGLSFDFSKYEIRVPKDEKEKFENELRRFYIIK